MKNFEEKHVLLITAGLLNKAVESNSNVLGASLFDFVSKLSVFDESILLSVNTTDGLVAEKINLFKSIPEILNDVTKEFAGGSIEFGVYEEDRQNEGRICLKIEPKAQREKLCLATSILKHLVSRFEKHKRLLGDMKDVEYYDSKPVHTLFVNYHF